MKNPLLHKLT